MAFSTASTVATDRLPHTSSSMLLGEAKRHKEAKSEDQAPIAHNEAPVEPAAPKTKHYTLLALHWLSPWLGEYPRLGR